jgi:hypothetical protein
VVTVDDNGVAMAVSLGHADRICEMRMAFLKRGGHLLDLLGTVGFDVDDAYQRGRQSGLKGSAQLYHVSVVYADGVDREVKPGSWSCRYCLMTCGRD